ncbi:MAG: hypothetical protein ABJ013_04180 [Halioglobus sp.]
MSIQDIGSIGELIAALATLATLIYLAIQVRQNTRALTSATFQNITAEMGKNVEPLSTNADLAAIMVKGFPNPDCLSAEERLRLSSVLVASFRRMESVYVQNTLGSIDDDLQAGFELSILTLLTTPFGAQWWRDAKVTFYKPFVAHLDKRVEHSELPAAHPSMLYDEKNLT